MMNIEKLKEMLDVNNNTKEASDVLGQAEDISRVLVDYFVDNPMEIEDIELTFEIESSQELIAEIPIGENIIPVTIRPKEPKQIVTVNLKDGFNNELFVGILLSLILAVGS